MLSLINTLDTNLFLFLNGLHSPLWDKIMLEISYNKYGFLALIIFLSYLGFKKYKKQFCLGFFFLLVSFGLSDSISTRVFKDNIKRLRPCHEKVLAPQVHLAGQKCWGGKFGFVSSHAANSFAIITFFWLMLRREHSWLKWFYLHAAVIGYSRIYLAKHYPLDIFFGAILGILCGLAGYKLFTSALARWWPQSSNQHG